MRADRRVARRHARHVQRLSLQGGEDGERGGGAPGARGPQQGRPGQGDPGRGDRLGEGGLLSIDSTEGVVKLAATGYVKMFQLAFLCKMKADD